LVFCLAADDLARGFGRLIRRAFAAGRLRSCGRFARLRVGLVELAFVAALAYQWDNQGLRNSSDVLFVPLRGHWDTTLVGIDLFFATYAPALVMAEIARRHKPLFRYLLLLLLLAALGASAAFTAHRSARWHRDYIAYYDSMLGKGLFRKLAESSSPGDTFCVMDERYYPFFGSARQFRIIQPPPTQSAARWQNSPARQKCNLIIIRPNINYKLTNVRYYITHNDRVHPIYTHTLLNHLVYSADDMGSRQGE
jgi:hypothetical protein